MVAMNVWPTDASDGSVATEARWRKMARTWNASGVCSSSNSLGLRPTLAFPNLTVNAGAAWVDGHYCELLSNQVLTVTATGLAVIRFDPAANTAELVYRDGVTTPAQSPTGVFELPIAAISGSALTDARGIVSPQGDLMFINATGRALGIPAPNRGDSFYLGSGGYQEGGYRWDGVAWRQPWNQPWGVIGQNTWNVDQPGFSPGIYSIVSGTPLSVATVPGRLLRFDWMANWGQSAVESLQSWRVAIDSTNTQAETRHAYPNHSGGQVGFHIWGSTAAVHSVYLTASTSAGVMNHLAGSYAPSRFLVTDLGPTSTGVPA